MLYEEGPRALNVMHSCNQTQTEDTEHSTEPGVSEEQKTETTILKTKTNKSLHYELWCRVAVHRCDMERFETKAPSPSIPMGLFDWFFVLIHTAKY